MSVSSPATPQPRRRIPSKKEFDTLMEDGAFVDYFNVFLNQPVFGQRVVYRHKNKDFILDPPVQKNRYKVFEYEVRDWLRTQRFQAFIQSDLFVEYNLCCRLRDTRDGFLQHKTGDLQSNKEFWLITTDFLIGHVTGMQYFRHSMLKTPGNIAFACWLDLERFRRLPMNDPERMKMYHHIKNTYLVSGAPQELSVIAKHQAFKGAVNFSLLHDEVSMEGPDFMRQILVSPTNGTEHFSIASPETFVRLQHVMLTALKSYWLPRYVLHVHNMAPKVPIDRPRSGRPCSARPCSGKSCCGRSCCGKPCSGRPCSGRPASGKLCCACVQEGNKDFFTDKTRMRLQTMFPDSLAESLMSVAQEEVLVDCRKTQHSADIEPESVEPSDLLTLWGGQRLFPTYEDLTSGRLSGASSMSHDSSLWTPTSAAAKETSILSHFPADSNFRRLYDTSEASGTDGKEGPGKQDLWKPRRPENSETENGDYQAGCHKVKSELSPTVRHLIRGQFYMTKSSFEQDNKRLVASITSETFAGRPLETYLASSSSFGSLGYLQLLNDLQEYLRADSNRTDYLGRSIKQLIGADILRRYSLEPGAKNSVFPAKDQAALSTSLMYGAPSEAVIRAQELCCMVLKPAWQAFINSDRQFFVNKVTRRGVSKLSPSNNVMGGDLRQVHQCPDIESKSMWAALELAVISRFPNGLKPECDIHELAAIKEQGFGSLGKPSQEPLYNHALREMVVHKKLKITNIRVSQRSLYKRPEIPAERSVTDTKSLQIKKNGVVIDRPPRPRCFLEILTNNVHYEFFKRYLVLKRASTPLIFWKQVQDLKETKNPRQRVTKVAQIFRRFFSKYAQYGAQLDCTDEIIKQVTQMERVTASMIVCAQGAVMRSLEKTWYDRYMATFPAGDDSRSPLPSPLPGESSPTFQEFEMEWSAPKRSPAKLQTYDLWLKFLRIVCHFIRCLKDRRQVLIFWLYLKLQVKKALQKKGGTSQEVKIVLQNRLLVVNKLPQDLLFWVEVAKYTEIMDGACKPGTLFILSKNDEDNLRVKANAIISCFLNSDIQPRLQVNVTQEAASAVITHLSTRGPTRSMFHESIMSIFPVLFHYFKNCCEEWDISKKNTDLDHVYTQKLVELKETKKNNSPHNSQVFPNYHNLTIDQFKRVVGPRGDDSFRIIFTISNGIKMIVPPDGGRHHRGMFPEGKRGSIVSPPASRRSSMVKEKPFKEIGHTGRSRLGSVAGPSRPFSTRAHPLPEEDSERLSSLVGTPLH